MVLANIPYDFENWVDKPFLFNLRMTDQMQVEDYLQNNLLINNDDYYIDYKQGTNIFWIKKQPTVESVNSEMVLDDLKIKLKDFLNSALLFDLNMASENEIEDWLLRNFPKNNSESKYYIEHEKGSDLYVIRSARENSKLIKKLIKIKKLINPLVYVGVPLRFDLDEIN